MRILGKYYTNIYFDQSFHEEYFIHTYVLVFPINSMLRNISLIFISIERNQLSDRHRYRNVKYNGVIF